MTAPKIVYRRRTRRELSTGDIPDEVAAWFQNGGPPPWVALLPVWRDGKLVEDGPDVARRAWREWRRRHPSATPPPGFEDMLEGSDG